MIIIKHYCLYFSHVTYSSCHVKEWSYCIIDSSWEHHLWFFKICNGEDVFERGSFPSDNTILSHSYTGHQYKSSSAISPHTLFLLLAMYSLALSFFKFMDVLFISDLPTSGVEGFTIKCDSRHHILDIVLYAIMHFCAVIWYWTATYLFDVI